MKMGTKSVLFGVHAFWWHPITVLFAWYELYGIPSWKKLICIFVHDLGYWGKPNMDGKEGEEHPELGANFAHKYLDRAIVKEHEFWYYNFCLYHSRTTAKNNNVEPSELCWADKLSIKYDPCWFYLLRAKLSGELNEYRSDAIKIGGITHNTSNKNWFIWAKHRGISVAYKQDPATAYEKLVI
jgi:hypothetical protein